MASVFFLDTAQNVVSYLEALHATLVPGGHLVNLGPLMYHWADDPGETSVELALDELLAVAGAVGFDVARHAMAPAGFNNGPGTMFPTAYDCAFTTFRKARPLFGGVPRPVGAPPRGEGGEEGGEEGP